MNGKNAMDYSIKYNHAKCVKLLLLNSKDKLMLDNNDKEISK